MNAPAFKTKAEQRLDWLTTLRRPLTPQESEDLRKSLHAVYCRDRRVRMLAKHRYEEIKLLKLVQKEARLPELRERS
jgi:hypothetical protein